jgi:photosystem II stability/assembly factor-like uncharacterized protein
MCVCINTNGQTWQIVGHAGTQAINNISFLTPDTGYAVNNYELWKTTDGGKTWALNYKSDSGVIISLFFIDAWHGWLCGGMLPPGYLMRTTDGGEHWKMQKGTVMQMYSCWFTSRKTGWAVANDATRGYHYRYKTQNGGRNWELIDTAFDYLRYVTFLNKKYGWILGDNSRMFRTNNGGNSWKKYTIDGVHHFNSMQAITPKRLWAVEQFTSGLVYQSADGGRKWQQKIISSTAQVQALCFTTPLNGWLACKEGRIFSTTNGGISWQSVPSPTALSLNSISFSSPGVGYIGGDNGTILKVVY